MPVLRKALEVNPGLAKSHFFLATALKAVGRYDEAIDHLRRAAASYPRDRVVLNQLGRVLFLKRQFPEAIGVLDGPHLERTVQRAVRAARPGKAHRLTRSAAYRTSCPLLRQGQATAARQELATRCPDPSIEAPKARTAALTYLEAQRDWIID